MLRHTFRLHLESIIGDHIIAIPIITGGDTSKAYLIKSKNNFFLKCNSSENALDLFKAEETGLNTIASTNTIKTPRVFNCGKIDSIAFILIEYIPPKRPTENEMALFGKQLAQMHQNTSQTFGFTSNNFIGSLDQTNNTSENWVEFYVNNRLVPQLKLAESRNLLNANEIPQYDQLLSTCNAFFGNIIPSLLHGDLWSGNYMISKFGEPYIIDPSVYYGHHEIDIAMSKLFGNFGEAFYTSYHKTIPKTKGFKDHITLYQLYYLLVHLNIFGASYHSSVKRILLSYF